MKNSQNKTNSSNQTIYFIDKDKSEIYTNKQNKSDKNCK